MVASGMPLLYRRPAQTCGATATAFQAYLKGNRGAANEFMPADLFNRVSAQGELTHQLCISCLFSRPVLERDKVSVQKFDCCKNVPTCWNK
jgi:hypothetical protein